MNLIIYILAALGAIALLRRIYISAARAVRHGVYTIYAREIAANRERRGDLTGWEEARAWVDDARRGRREALISALLWCALLIGPIWAPIEALPIYAFYPLIWLIPTLPAREWKGTIQDHRSSGRDS